jgi:hypothetical protein
MPGSMMVVMMLTQGYPAASPIVSKLGAASEEPSSMPFAALKEEKNSDSSDLML